MQRKRHILLEMRPALEGFAGIPQEVRLLFRALRELDDVSVSGLLQHGNRTLAKAVDPKARRALPAGKRFRRHSNVIISVTSDRKATKLRKLWLMLRRRVMEWRATIFGVRFTRFDTAGFEDFVWRQLFAKSLPASDRPVVTAGVLRVSSLAWDAFHRIGRRSLRWRRIARYPLVDLDDVSIFITQTPYPGRIRPGKAMIVRYHDAVPVFFPHTISDKRQHLAHHFDALAANVADEAWFACVSEASRMDLLRLFPEAEARSVTIPNIVSPAYVAAPSEPSRVADIIRSRVADATGWLPNVGTGERKEGFYRKHLREEGLDYLLMVGTVEPRKNHLRLLAAWERLRANGHPNLKLVVVGTLGWEFESTMHAFLPWIERGQLFLLNSVPASDLRILYACALVTICPSLAEGFDFPGVEAMASGGLLAASDIPVHREIFGETPRWFDPYSTASCADAIDQLIGLNDAVKEGLRARGADFTARYRMAAVLPQWDMFLRRVHDAA